MYQDYIFVSDFNGILQHKNITALMYIFDVYLPTAESEFWFLSVKVYLILLPPIFSSIYSSA